MTTHPLPPHLHVFEGSLYDTRRSDWSARPVRENYSRHHRDIRTVADLKATLRAGAYAWPGGYPLYFITSDGDALSFETVREEFPRIATAIRDSDRNGWRVVGCDVNWEDAELLCTHSSRRIESAYGD